MNTISIKEFKTKLRGYLDKISHGEKFIITEQGKEAAIMMPVPRERRVMHSLMKAKKAKWNGGKPAGIKGIRIKGESLSRTILEGRYLSFRFYTSSIILSPEVTKRSHFDI